MKALDLLSERLTDAKLAPHIKSVREEVRNGSLLSDAFARQGVFPPIYVTSVLAGEKSGALGEVLDRFITYQKLALAVRKKIDPVPGLSLPADRAGDLPDGVPDHLRGS